MTAERRTFYATALAYLHTAHECPTAQAFASWLELQPFTDPPPDLSVMLNRLRRWPEGAPYPAFPDDDALAGGVKAKAGWWRPRSPRGGA